MLFFKVGGGRRRCFPRETRRQNSVGFQPYRNRSSRCCGCFIFCCFHRNVCYTCLSFTSFVAYSVIKSLSFLKSEKLFKNQVFVSRSLHDNSRQENFEINLRACLNQNALLHPLFPAPVVKAICPSFPTCPAAVTRELSCLSRHLIGHLIPQLFPISPLAPYYI